MEPDTIVAAPDAPSNDVVEAPTEPSQVAPQAVQDALSASDVPEKFRGPEGQLRADALLKSYLELERKVGAMLPAPSDPDDRVAQERLFSALGRPVDPSGYVIERKADWLDRDLALEERLHAAGLSNQQAQLVYDLAAERIAPLVEAAIAEAETLRDAQVQRGRLEEQFGGPERFSTIAQQLKAFGERHLEPSTYDALSRSFDGVMALHAMMRAKEPEIIGGHDQASLIPDRDQLTRMMRDPRYWRDRDKDFVARVTDGYRRLYGS